MTIAQLCIITLVGVYAWLQSLENEYVGEKR